MFANVSWHSGPLILFRPCSKHEPTMDRRWRLCAFRNVLSFYCFLYSCCFLDKILLHQREIEKALLNLQREAHRIDFSLNLLLLIFLISFYFLTAHNLILISNLYGCGEESSLFLDMCLIMVIYTRKDAHFPHVPQALYKIFFFIII